MVNSRKELVNWFNDLGIEIDRIEDLGKGNAICELISQIHHTFPLNFIKKPTNEYEYLKNMKIIQAFLIANKIELYFPVEKLIKCKLQDNLEVAQKLYKYYVKMSYGKSKVTEEDKMSKSISECLITNKPKETPKKPLSSSFSLDREACRKEIIENLTKEKNKMQEEEKKRIEDLEEENKKLKETINVKDLEICKFKGIMGELGSVKEILKAMEANRDFYFKKLVEIEKYLEVNKEICEDAKTEIFEILYKKNE